MRTRVARALGGTASASLLLAMASGPTSGTPDTTAEPGGDLRHGQVVTLAGNGEAGYSGDGGDALDARLNSDLTLSVTADGEVHVADRLNQRLRVVAADGTIDSVAVTGVPRASAPGPDGSLYVAGEEAISRIAADGSITEIADVGHDSISGTDSIDVDGAGNVYVADYHANRIHKIDTAGVITTIAGGGDVSPAVAAGLPATAVNVPQPVSVAVDSASDVYFTLDQSGAVYRIDADGTFSTVTDPEPGFAGDGGPAANARMAEVSSRNVAVDDEDNLYITDGTRVRMVDPDGIISTVGPQLPELDDLAVGATGDLYFTSGPTVYMLVRTEQPADAVESTVEPAPSAWPDERSGTVIDVAGTPSDPDAEPGSALPGIVNPQAGPRAVAVDAAGTMYVADTERHIVHRVSPEGDATVLAGTGAAEFSGEDEPAGTAALTSPSGLAVDDAGAVFIADTGNRRVRKVDAEGVIRTVARVPRPVDVAVGPDGGVYLADAGTDTVRKVGPDGDMTTIAGGGDLSARDGDNAPATEASLSSPRALDVDAEGNVYFIEEGLPRVRMVRADGVLVTIAGDSARTTYDGGFSGDGGPAVAAELNTPMDLAVDADGTVYVADTFNSRIRAIDTAGAITTIAGTGAPHETGDGGPASEAGLDEPHGVAVGDDGSLYLTGPRSGTVRAIDTGGTIDTVVAAENFAGTGERPGSGATAAIDTAFPQLRAVDVGADGKMVVASLRGVDFIDATGGLTPLEVGEPLVAASEPLIEAGEPPVVAGAVAVAPTGDRYVVLDGNVVRVSPDGAAVTVAANAPEGVTAEDGQNALTARLVVADLAVGPDAELYLADANSRRVFTLGDDGTLVEWTDLSTLDSVGGIAVGPDGTLYVADTDGHRVYSVAANGRPRPLAGTGGDTLDADDIGDGGPAVEAAVRSPRDVAVGADGEIYVSGASGIRRITEGTINTVLDAYVEDEEHTGLTVRAYAPTVLAIGPGGDLYFVDDVSDQVRALVRPADTTESSRWGWYAGALVVVAGGGAFWWRRRSRPEGPSAALTAS